MFEITIEFMTGPLFWLSIIKDLLFVGLSFVE